MYSICIDIMMPPVFIFPNLDCALSLSLPLSLSLSFSPSIPLPLFLSHVCVCLLYNTVTKCLLKHTEVPRL